MFAPGIAKDQIKATESLTSKRAKQVSTSFSHPPAYNAPEKDPGDRESAPGASWVFSKMPVVAPDRAASTAASDKNQEIRSTVKHHRHAFSAAIRRVSPVFQNDSMSSKERKP